MFEKFKKNIQKSKLEELSEKGDHESALKLAEIYIEDYYINNFGSNEDLTGKAFEWIERSAELGNREAECIMGYVYLWQEWSLNLEYKSIYIGNTYVGGKLLKEILPMVKKDREYAKKWFLLSAGQNWGPAQIVLLDYFYEGNYERSLEMLELMLFKSSDREFYIEAKQRIADIYFVNWEYENGRKIQSKKKKRINIEKCIELYNEVIELHISNDDYGVSSPINECKENISSLHNELDYL